MEVFGDLLKGFRLRRGRNQEWLANKLGKHRNTISDWERAEYLPDDRETVLAISDALGLSKVETDELLFAANYPLEHQSKNLQQTSVAQFKEVSAETISGCQATRRFCSSRRGLCVTPTCISLREGLQWLCCGRRPPGRANRASCQV
jgi:transcriptional regulator with XRE-family HTH domain